PRITCVRGPEFRVVCDPFKKAESTPISEQDDDIDVLEPTDHDGIQPRPLPLHQRPPDSSMPNPDPPAESLSPGKSLAHDLVARIDDVLQEAAATGQPIELDPPRSQLFELFVMAEATGFLEEGAEHDLTCDGVAREL